jgi:hypothetical protein
MARQHGSLHPRFVSALTGMRQVSADTNSKAEICVSTDLDINGKC